MPSSTIETSFMEQYRANITHLSQQKHSKLSPYVKVETGVTGKRHAFDFLGEMTPKKRTTRHADSPLSFADHTRRWATMSDYDDGYLVDDQDKIRTLNDPTNDYVMGLAAGFNRVKDDIIIEAAFADVVTGEDGDGTSSYGTTAYDGTNPIAARVIAHDYDEFGGITTIGTGLTVAKLRAIKTIFMAREVDESLPIVLVVSAQQKQDLLRSTEVTSNDFNTVRALVNGDVDTFMGIKFVNIERLDVSGDERRCIAFAGGGIALGLGKDVEGHVGPRPDKSYSTYVYAKMTAGAVRREDAKVLEVRCQEPAATS